MKKLACILLALAMLLPALVGCSNAPAEAEKKTDDAPAASADKVASAAFGGVENPADQLYLWCSYESTDDFMLMVYEGFEACGKMLGVQTQHVGTSQNDLTEYINSVERAISMKPNGLAVHVFNADAYVDVINKATDNGIPVITTGPDSPNSKRICNIGVENYDAGAFGAKILGEKLNGEGNVLILIRAGQHNSEQRVSGFKETLAEKYPNMNIVTEISVTAEIADQASKTAAALTANPEIDAVFSLDDETSIGALQAIEDAGRTDIKVITGGGGCQEYFNIIAANENINVCSALYSPLMVKDAVDEAVALLKGETVDPVKVIPTTIVDRSNVADYLDPENTVY